MLLRAKTPKNIRVPTSGGGDRRTSSIMNLNLPLLFSAAAVLALSALLPSAEAKISVVNKAPRDGTIVKEGRPVRLSCRTSARDEEEEEQTLYLRFVHFTRFLPLNLTK